MSDAAAPTLSEKYLGTMNDLTGALAQTRAGMASAEKGAEKSVADENKVLGQKKDLIEQQRGENKQFDKDHPFPQPDIKPWTQKPPQNDPLGSFGSWASAFGILAGAITKTGLASSLNASAAAMQALKQGKWEQYTEAKKAWKENTEIAIKQAEWETQRYNHAWELMKTDQSAAMAELNATAEQAKNGRVVAELKTGNLKAVWEMTRGLADFAAQGPERMARMEELSNKLEDVRERAKLYKQWQDQHKDAKPEEAAAMRTQIMNPQYTIAQARVLAEGAAGGAGAMGNDPITIQYWAKRVRAGEPMPALGTGRDAALSRRLIAKQAAHDAYEQGGTAEGDLVKKATLRAESQSLTKQVAQQHAIDAFESTAMKNADIAQSLVDKIDSTGSPVIERWIRAGRKAIAGDPDVTNFDFQIGILTPEIAKIITNPNLTGILSDSARAEVQSLIDKNITAEQMRELIPLIKGDFARRSQSIKEEIEATQESIRELATMDEKGGKGESQTTFADEKEAMQAYHDKKIKLGDTITIGGKSKTVSE